MFFLILENFNTFCCSVVFWKHTPCEMGHIIWISSCITVENMNTGTSIFSYMWHYSFLTINGIFASSDLMFAAMVRPVGGFLFPPPGAAPVTIPRLHKKPMEKIIQDRHPQLLLPNPEENSGLHCFASSPEDCGRVSKWCWGTLALLKRRWTLSAWLHPCGATPRCSASPVLTVHLYRKLSEQEGLKRSLVTPGIWLSAVQPLPCWISGGVLVFAHSKPSCARFSAYAFTLENGCRYIDSPKPVTSSHTVTAEGIEFAFFLFFIVKAFDGSGLSVLKLFCKLWV